MVPRRTRYNFSNHSKSGKVRQSQAKYEMSVRLAALILFSVSVNFENHMKSKNDKNDNSAIAICSRLDKDQCNIHNLNGSEM